MYGFLKQMQLQNPLDCKSILPDSMEMQFNSFFVGLRSNLGIKGLLLTEKKDV